MPQKKPDRTVDDQIKAFAKTPGLRERLYLVKNGVPFDVAFSLDDIEATAFLIILHEMDGGTFDWSEMRWRRRDE